MLLTFIICLNENQFLPGGGGNAIRQNTPHSNKTQHRKLYKE
jgi:hypothetical protein